MSSATPSWVHFIGFTRGTRRQTDICLRFIRTFLDNKLLLLHVKAGNWIYWNHYFNKNTCLCLHYHIEAKQPCGQGGHISQQFFRLLLVYQRFPALPWDTDQKETLIFKNKRNIWCFYFKWDFCSTLPPSDFGKNKGPALLIYHVL